MFGKLRRQFVLTTMLIVTVVLVVSFTAIYMSSYNSLHRNNFGPPPFRKESSRVVDIDSETREIFNKRLHEVATKSLDGLLTNLIFSGVAILIVVYFVSRFVADRAVSAIEKSYERQRLFIAEASHELKTPITIISTNIEAAISDTKKPSKWLNNAKNESERMGRLVSSLLQLARIDSHTAVEISEFDASQVMSEVADCFSPIAIDKNIKVISKQTPSLIVESDKNKLDQLLMILVDNALKYTKPKGTVTLSSVKKNNKILLSVANTHPHVDSGELDRFFDRFYQADESHHEKGHGLGLAIAKGLASEIGSSISASSIKNRIIFSIELNSKNSN